MLNFHFKFKLFDSPLPGEDLTSTLLMYLERLWTQHVLGYHNKYTMCLITDSYLLSRSRSVSEYSFWEIVRYYLCGFANHREGPKLTGWQQNFPNLTFSERLANIQYRIKKVKEEKSSTYVCIAPAVGCMGPIENSCAKNTNHFFKLQQSNSTGSSRRVWFCNRNYNDFFW